MKKKSAKTKGRSGGRRTQDDQVTSAPRAVKVSMRTAVWMVLETQEQGCHGDSLDVSLSRTCGDIQQCGHPSGAGKDRTA